MDKQEQQIALDMEKTYTLGELGDTTVISEPLTAADDRRILRKIDMKYVLLCPIRDHSANC
jgi:hypothetical protein